MHHANKLLFTLPLLLLSACATQPTPTPDSKPAASTPEKTGDTVILKKTIAPETLSRQKNDKELKLVRVMEGGACKNERQGVTGMFMLYAHPADVERIKKARGPKVFAGFERDISKFSMQALQKAVNGSEFSKFVYIEEETKAAKKKTTAQLLKKFDDHVATAISQFEKETTLTITVEPSVESLQFYVDGCDLPHAH